MMQEGAVMMTVIASFVMVVKAEEPHRLTIVGRLQSVVQEGSVERSHNGKPHGERVDAVGRVKSRLHRLVA